MKRGAWERWFAWHPVRMVNGKKVWLRYVERSLCCGGCALFGDFWWAYRPVGGAK